ncbi:hypothetical protein GCM10017771_52060 [Streptomyces capitiformicae]|uniref:Uncharacterized protein n=1 Tax=Streptomyces capitiformicae TaxID=2014920 RepID=A0A918Z4W1_9ACTN|nr:hypothetical protein GCM10017771_52060 [Streptomyces capitiformicae]
MRSRYVQPTAHSGEASPAFALRSRPSRAQLGYYGLPLEAARGRFVGSFFLSTAVSSLGRFSVRAALYAGGRFRRSRSLSVPGGRGCGRGDHGPDHGLCVPIVTVVGGSWSVVGSGSTGFLKVSKYTF